MFSKWNVGHSTGGKAGTIRAYNRKLIFNLVASHGPVSRSALAQRLKLSVTAVSDILNELKGAGLIRYTGVGLSNGGRPPILVEASSDFICLLGLSMDVGYTSAILAGPGGELLGKTKRPSAAAGGPEAVIRQLIEAGQEVMEKHQGKRTLIAFGLAVSAPVNPKGFFRPPDMVGWESLEVPVKRLLSDAFGAMGIVDNDANLGALAEMYFGEHRESSHLAYVLIHRGVGAGIVSNGAILRGMMNWAGELGHMVIDPDGPRCNCGNYGCLESFVSSRKLVEYAVRGARFGRPTKLAPLEVDQLHSEAVIAAALDGDRAAIAALEQTGEWLGIGLANLVSLINPEVVVLGGSLTKAGQLLLEPARQVALARLLPELRANIRIEMSTLGEDGPLLGAVACAMDKALEQDEFNPMVEDVNYAGSK